MNSISCKQLISLKIDFDFGPRAITHVQDNTTQFIEKHDKIFFKKRTMPKEERIGRKEKKYTHEC